MVRTYWVYIMTNRSGTLYTGVTGDLDKRVYEHRQRLVPGFTSRYQIDRLVHAEPFAEVRDAIAREADQGVGEIEEAGADRAIESRVARSWRGLVRAGLARRCHAERSEASRLKRTVVAEYRDSSPAGGSE
jgi:predicted GIY-YIG superfamily endonuclease